MSVSSVHRIKDKDLRIVVKNIKTDVWGPEQSDNFLICIKKIGKVRFVFARYMTCQRMQRCLAVKILRAEQLPKVVDILCFERDIGIMDTKIIDDLLRSNSGCNLRLDLATNTWQQGLFACARHGGGLKGTMVMIPTHHSDNIASRRVRRYAQERAPERS